MRYLVSVVLLTEGCMSSEAPRPAVVVFAAASTADALEAAAQEFRRTEAVEVRLAFGGSATLARQIEAGAEADLFLSASPEWADYLSDKGLAAERRNLMGNRLVAVVPADASKLPASPEALSDPGIARIAVGDPDAVPAGMYARQALQKLGVWERLRPKLVPAGNVREALLYVEQSEADAGIVYATDAAGSTRVRVAFEFDPALTDPIRYPLVLLKPAQDNPNARRFYDYLTSETGQRIFEQYGFIRVE